MTETARVQYVFLDVVGFTKNRSVEAQSDVVERLNSIVKSALEAQKAPQDKTVLIPTGDGIAIALIEVPGFDIHLQLALHILCMVAEHNSSTLDTARQFEVRIGINENIDNIIYDVNECRNVAGAGISMAQRIMDKADGGQILVGSTVHDVLRQREQYMSCFKAYTAKGKHGITFPVYQFVSKGAPGLNVAIPSVFVVKRSVPEKFTKYEAYYVAHAITHKPFLISKKADGARNYTASILLNFLAEDSENASNTPMHETAIQKTWKAGKASFEEQYRHYDELELWVAIQLSDLLLKTRLESFTEHLDGPEWDKSTWMIKASGVQKLISEWPEIANEFEISL